MIIEYGFKQIPTDIQEVKAKVNNALEIIETNDLIRQLVLDLPGKLECLKENNFQVAN